MKPLLTQKEVAELLRVSLKTLQNWRREGKLRFIRLGHRTIRIRAEEVERLAALAAMEVY